MEPLGVAEGHPVADHPPGLEAVGDFFEVDRLQPHLRHQAANPVTSHDGSFPPQIGRDLRSAGYRSTGSISDPLHPLVTTQYFKRDFRFELVCKIPALRHVVSLQQVRDTP
jgi:hypothetical protein